MLLSSNVQFVAYFRNMGFVLLQHSYCSLTKWCWVIIWCDLILKGLTFTDFNRYDRS